MGPAPQGPPPGMWMPPQMPMRPFPMVRLGHLLNMIGMLLVGIGAIVGAFSLGGITYSGTYVGGTPTVNIGSAAFVGALVLIGVGIILRAVGYLFVNYK